MKVAIVMSIMTHTIKKGGQNVYCVELVLGLVWNLSWIIEQLYYPSICLSILYLFHILTSSRSYNETCIYPNHPVTRSIMVIHVNIVSFRFILPPGIRYIILLKYGSISSIWNIYHSYCFAIVLGEIFSYQLIWLLKFWHNVPGLPYKNSLLTRIFK